ncbi:hypothetical protein ACQPXT_13580 [Streptomyces sp. CA-100214]
MTEQERAAKAYEAGRESRDPDVVQLGRDNARIDGAATGTQAGGGR